MKKILALLLALVLTCTVFSALADGVYSATYDITNDYMEEDEDTGALNLTAIPSTPLGENSAAVGYAGSFGAFVDAVSVDVTLEITGETYVYTLKVHCGTDACTLGSYSPVFTWTGKVLEASGTAIRCAAPEHATVTILAAGQFATNEEQIGYFGAPDYTADETTTDCPYPMVPSGEKLLGMFGAGTFTVEGETIVAYEIEAAE